MTAHSPTVRLRVGLPAKLQMSCGPDVVPMSDLMWAWCGPHVTWSHGPDMGLMWVWCGPDIILSVSFILCCIICMYLTGGSGSVVPFARCALLVIRSFAFQSSISGNWLVKISIVQFWSSVIVSWGGENNW